MENDFITFGNDCQGIGLASRHSEIPDDVINLVLGMVRPGMVENFHSALESLTNKKSHVTAQPQIKVAVSRE